VRAVAVHGGAGREAADDRQPRRAGVARAADAAWGVVARGGSALDAVVAAVAVLEDDPYFNAGTGSVLTVAGTVEMDASVMAGDTLAAGAVGAVRGVRNPVRLARVVLDRPEVMLVGEPARELAARYGLACEPDALVTDAARRRSDEPPGETVGAVVCDASGHVAAATSTGGIAGKPAGRVGDSAVIGAGTYADDLIGAGSATGPGEAIIRFVLVRGALDLVRAGADPGAAARSALDALAQRLRTRAGLIVVDGAGRVGIAHTTETMASAWRTDATGGTILGP
jgi:L-asparaginase / beta-aspartyl-peptidase